MFHSRRLQALVQTAVVVGIGCSLGQLYAVGQRTDNSPKLPAFEVATVRPEGNKPVPMLGFYGYPGGRIYFGGALKMLVEYAFNLRSFQIVGGPEWVSSKRFEITAIAPEGSASTHIQSRMAEPMAEQRLMLQSLLHDRFGFTFHIESKEGEVYFLMVGNKPLQLKPPTEPASDPRAIVAMWQGGIVDGQAFGTNTTMDYLAVRLGDYLQLPVINRTGILGSYDFTLPAADPENKDMTYATFSVVDRLGLKLKRGRGPVQTLIMDHLDSPSEN